ncbi:hypothetical protein ES703_69085 [subsurface metagenome]
MFQEISFFMRLDLRRLEEWEPFEPFFFNTTFQKGVKIMALVKYGGGITQMSGSIAGNTFARNRYGNYVRARTKPVNPKTAQQIAVRTAVAYLADYWAQTLSAAQRAAWGLYASNVVMKNKLGESINLSGFNHFIRSNAWLRAILSATPKGPPVIFELPSQDGTLAVTASEATQQLTVTYDDGLAWADETGGFLILYQGQPQNAQRNFFAGPWRYMWTVSGVDAAPPAGPVVCDAIFAIAETQRQWIYARILRKDGRLSEIFRADCFTAA